MLNIKFRVDKNILTREIISKSCMPTDLANFLWSKYNSSYVQLQKNILADEIDLNILLELQSQNFFKKAYYDATQNSKRIEKGWVLNKEKINSFLFKALKTDCNLNVLCYIVSPDIKAGHSIGNNSFVWGHEKGVECLNYDLVYLVHESLHSFFPNDSISHTIIENIADIELSKYLNNTELGYEGHSYLIKNHIAIFPFWNLYLNKTISEIKQLQKIQGIKYKIEKFEHDRDYLSKSDINGFLNFIKEKIDSVNYITSYEII